MSMSKTFRTAFEEGCGVSYETVLQSKEYAHLLNKERGMLSRAFARTRPGKVFRCSHFELSRLFDDFNFRPGADSVMRPRISTSIGFRSGFLKQKVIVKLLGRKLVSAAKKKLPDEAILLAKDFRSSNDRQEKIRIAFTFYLLLRKIIRERQKDNPDNETFWKLLDLYSKKYDKKNYLPAKLGKYGHSQSHPSCLGMAILLVAWGRLAKARVTLVTPFVCQDDLGWEVEGKIGNEILSEARKRGLLLSRRFVNATKENIDKANVFSHTPNDFHAGIVIDIDHVLMYIDPYFCQCGVLDPRCWHSAGTRVLEKIKEVQPGVTITCCGNGYHQRNLEEYYKELKRALEVSRSFEKLLIAAPASKYVFM